jgi:UDP-glucose:(heptosyl)LPS alpha-1,3-glucosyltransferase
MKIALVHMRHRHVGGTERYLNQLAAHLADSGDDVTIVCRSHEEAPHPAVRFVRLHPPAVGGTWRMWSFARAVERHVRDHRYDIVFGLGKTWTHDVIRLGGGCHQTYLDIAHEATLKGWEKRMGVGWLKHRLALLIEQRALRPGAYRRVITNSEMVKRDAMQRYAVPADRVTVIYNGVDVQRFHPRLRDSRGAEIRRACGFEPEHFVVLFLGTEYGRKGLAPVIEAFPDLIQARPRARLVVVGYDSARPRYKRLVTDLGIQAHVRFLGGRRDAENCFAAADLYVLPTLYDPFANSTLEALATGLPVITTATNGASELLTPEVNGSVLQARPAAADVLRALLLWTEGYRSREALTAARALAEKYSQERTACETRAVLETVAAEKACSSNA